MKHREIIQLDSKMVFRSLGGEDSTERIGLGIMNKAGRISGDEESYTPPYALIYVVRGTGRFVEPSGVEHILGPGSIFQRHPNSAYRTSIDPESNWLECFIDLGPETYKLLKLTQVIRDEYVYTVKPDHWIEETCYKLMKQLDSCQQHELSEMFAKVISYLTELMRRCQYPQSDDKIERMIRESCEYLRENSKVKVDIHRYCKSNGWGYDTFRKYFRQRVGMAPGKYQIRARLEQAAQMLSTTKKTVEEIADQLNYSSPFAFSTQFKQHTGLSPKHYRSGK